jgi:hypothetical protein
MMGWCGHTRIANIFGHVFGLVNIILGHIYSYFSCHSIYYLLFVLFLYTYILRFKIIIFIHI